MPTQNIIAFSGGKDSTATVILAHEHGIKAKVVMAVLWFDRARTIPAIDVDHWNFIVNTIVPKFEEWGFEVEFVHAKRDYVAEFNDIVKKSKKQERNGKKRGFLIAGFCKMTHQKQLAVREIEKRYADCLSIQGIAVDEAERLEKLHNRGAISLLEQYGHTEQMALDLCKKYGLLSPIYASKSRDGCWFCPNQRISEWASLRENHPELWHELQEMSEDNNLVTKKIARNDTLEDISRKIDRYLEREKQAKCQISFFDYAHD